jgi:hypothetical protein
MIETPWDGLPRPKPNFVYKSPYPPPPWVWRNRWTRFLLSIGRGVGRAFGLKYQVLQHHPTIWMRLPVAYYHPLWRVVRGWTSAGSRRTHRRG